MNKRRWYFRLGAVALLLLIAALMLRIGRGHTLYFDNKTMEYEGTSYPAAQRIVVKSKGAEVAKLAKRERGMMTWIGQNFQMELAITQVKDGETLTQHYKLQLPYHTDGIVFNLPALVAGLPEAAYMSEFVPLIAAPTQEDEVVITDEFELPEDT